MAARAGGGARFRTDGLRPMDAGVQQLGLPDARRSASPVTCISSDSLLAGASEVHIEHRGSLYRLKQTALGKLILTK